MPSVGQDLSTSSVDCVNACNRPWYEQHIWVVVCVTRQKLFPMKFGHDTHLNQVAWSKDTLIRIEVGQFAARLFAEQVVT